MRLQPGSVVPDEPTVVGARGNGNVPATGWAGGIKCGIPVRSFCFSTKHKKNEFNREINEIFCVQGLYLQSTAIISVFKQHKTVITWHATWFSVDYNRKTL